VRWKGAALAHRAFDKKQRVTHTAIVANKRLSEALAWVKARQDEMRAAPVKSASEAGGYVSRPKGKRGRISFIDRRIAAKKANAAAAVGSAAMCEVSAPRQRLHPRVWDISNLHTPETFQTRCNTVALALGGTTLPRRTPRRAICECAPSSRLGLGESHVFNRATVVRSLKTFTCLADATPRWRPRPHCSCHSVSARRS
jgi:hypothetical protein